MRKTGDLFKKISDTKGIFHAKLGTHTHIKKDKKKKKKKKKEKDRSYGSNRSRSKEIPGLIGKFCLAVQNEAG